MPVVYLETLVFQVVAAYKGWDSKQVNEDILKNPTPKWVIHGKVAMMMRFKGYPFYLIHNGHVKVSRPFNVGGYRAHYKLKELAYNERMVYFRKFIKWNRGCG